MRTHSVLSNVVPGQFQPSVRLTRLLTVGGPALPCNKMDDRKYEYMIIWNPKKIIQQRNKTDKSNGKKKKKKKD